MQKSIAVSFDELAFRVRGEKTTKEKEKKKEKKKRKNWTFYRTRSLSSSYFIHFTLFFVFSRFYFSELEYEALIDDVLAVEFFPMSVLFPRGISPYRLARFLLFSPFSLLYFLSFFFSQNQNTERLSTLSLL